MAGAAPEAWRSDPYRRHELRYWDGQAWTPHVSDFGLIGHDPVFPIPDGDAHDYLAPAQPRRRLPGVDRAAAWAIGGFVAVIALAVASAVNGVSPAPAPTSRPVAGVEAAAAEVGAAKPGAAPAAPLARAALAEVAVGEATAAVAVQRVWADVDRNGCSTSDDVLRRDLADARLRRGGCAITSGTLHDPYTGATVAYRAAGGSNRVGIDHVVSLGNAWRTGAPGLSADRQQALANDPLNLLAVSAAQVRRKGDADAAGWLPPKAAFRCAYVARQIAVKSAYGLWVTPAERAAMRRVLDTCPLQRLPSSEQAAPPALTP